MKGLGFLTRTVGRRVRYWSPLGQDWATMRRMMRRGRLVMGAGSYGLPLFQDHDPTVKVIVGNYASLGSTFMLGGHHRMSHVTTYPFHRALMLPGIENDRLPSGDTHVGSDTWLGHGSLIMSGVTIGDGAVVGTNAVVTKDVPPYAVVAGVPARVIKYRHTEEQRDALLRIRWWDWPEPEIHEAVPLLMSDDIDDFIAWADARSAPAQQHD